MNLDSGDARISLQLSPEFISELKALDKQRKLSEKRFLLWLAAPVLIPIPFLFGSPVFGLAWLFIVLFGLGTYIHVILKDTNEIDRRYKKIVLPEMMKQAGMEGEYSLSHGLSVESFLKAGLYRERYSHFERYDSIIGKYKGISFGLYELAVQVSGGRGGSVGVGVGVTPGYKLLTNHFYGWVLHVPVRRLNGKTYIIPASRKTKHETDDWLKEVHAHFRSSEAGSILTFDDAFDKTFHVYSTNPDEALKMLQPAFRELLLRVYTGTANAPAFSFCEGRAYMHIGIQGFNFDPQKGMLYYPAHTEVLSGRLRFFSAMVLALHTAAANAN